ncbi:MAG: phosphatidate cytidylyltransferase [Candidatus Cloacimonetes bacterium]|jgi:dolichol kinase|nr:phosphatidate cytidylyltransferase [Candidatus Cloacimonadota bacterium]MDD4157051.1 phosphatidate cytidylyltransferase [Candidatus Cloacimonadota bacterium]
MSLKTFFFISRSANKDNTQIECYRKAIHISSIILPITYRYIFNYNRKLTILIFLAIAIVSIIVELLRLENRSFKKLFYSIFGIMLRKHEMYDFTGASYLLTSAIICVAFFPKDIAFASMAFLSIGDTMAALIGINLGKRKFLNIKKTFEGFLACFISTFIFGLFFLNPFIAFFGSLTAAIAELVRIPIDDNVKIPILSGIAMMIVYMFV